MRALFAISRSLFFKNNYLWVMSLNPVLDIRASPDYEIFDFESDGRSRLKRRIQFDLINPKENMYNLALCTVLANGTLDCDTDTRDGDMDTVLETAAHVGILYINKFPDRKVFLRGSDARRSRKYQMGINRYLLQLAGNYIIEGVTIVNNEITRREFVVPGKNYQAFIFSKQKN